MLVSDSFSQWMEKAASALRSNAGGALEFADQAIEAAGKDELRQAAAWRVRGQALRALGRHADALAAFESAAAAARQAGDERLAAQVRIGSVDSLGMLARYEEAIDLAQRLEQTFRDYGAEADAAKVLVNAGSLHFRRDRYAEALDCYQRAGEILQKSGDPAMRAYLQTNSANVLTLLHRVEEAVHLYETARALFVERGMAADTAVVDLNVGFLHYASGRHALALAALTNAYRAFTACGREQQAARCAVDRGDVYRALNLHPEALADYDRALEVFERLPTDYDRARAEFGRAAVLLAQDHLQEALASLERADALFRAQKNRLQGAHVRWMRAVMRRQEGRIEEARREAQAAMRVFAKNGLRGWAAEARFLLAESYLEEGHNAARSMQSVCRIARRYARGWLECRAERALGRYYARQQDRRRALRHLRAAVHALEDARSLIAPEEMHVAFLRDKLAVYEDLIELLLARGTQNDMAEALECVERAKSRLLLERVLSALEGRPASTAVNQARERLETLRGALSREYYRAHTFHKGGPRRLPGEPAIDLPSLLPLEQAYREALRDVELAEQREGQTAFSLSAVATTEALQEALQPDETLVEFCSVKDALWAFLLTRERMVTLPLGAGMDEVANLQRRLRFHLQRLETTPDFLLRHADRVQTGIQETLRRLYTALLEPLQEWLAAEKIVLVPHGPLHGLSFHALFDGERHALDRWEFLYAPSATIWQAGVRRREAKGNRREEREERPSCLLMAVPLSGIEEVTKEVAQLAHLLPGSNVYRAEEATIGAFRQEAPTVHRLHLATHAQFRADNPLFSGLRLADGWLLARDLYEMTLDCDLATLSACFTGAGRVEPGDEVFGLMRGFLAAGARSVAASLWAVDDAVTTDLMVRFYGNLMGGMTKAAALRAAQRAMRESYPHPYHWAAFVLVGER